MLFVLYALNLIINTVIIFNYDCFLTKPKLMIRTKDESLFRDLRFWLIIFFSGVLLSLLIMNYPV
jgi:hypothetical protein